MINVKLSENEQKVINALYEHFRETGKWVGVRTLHQRLGREVVKSVVSRKTLKFIIKFQENGNGPEYYKLSFLGIYLCPKAQDDIELLYRYLNLLKQKFNENPEFREVTSSEVESSLNLTKEQSERLKNLISISCVWGGSASHGKEWRFGIPDDIEDLAEARDAKEYLEKRIKKGEERTRRVNKLKGIGFDMYRLGFWTFLTVILWRAFFDIARYFHKILSYYIMLVIWFTLFSMTKILEVFKIKVPFFSSEKILEKILWWVITIIISASGWLAIKFLSK